MKLIIGLGNIGEKYYATRHNVGFLCLDEWARLRKKSFSAELEYDFIKLEKAVLIKPKTFMNLSGKALQAARERWKIDQVLVIYDDIELPLADLRIRNGGGDGGHNGMKSLGEILPYDELKRIRFGIGRDAELCPADFVLQDFNEDELIALKPMITRAGKFIDTYIKYDFSTMLDEYSKWKKSYSGVKSTGIISPKEEQNDQGL
ncbi:MAG: aminoacyl-tRNA hydrolase [Candidatus Cloacimonadaceae bacterium]|nr:aminoacyl-tRNA hydrolase [Candidatus Cloacimonadaceae bacterium]MDP3114121.1 aminoacyl-tRNA hydrolase [Candidatus Cloacimonadaceae bacterium]